MDAICWICRQAEAKELHHLIPKRALPAAEHCVPLCQHCHDLVDRFGLFRDEGVEWICRQSVVEPGPPWANVLLLHLLQMLTEESVELAETLNRQATNFMPLLLEGLKRHRHQVLVEQTRNALKEKKQQGQRLGTTPLGYRTITTPNGERTIEIDAVGQATVERARELSRQGKALRQIALILTEEGRPTKRGGKWHAQTVGKLLKPRYLEEIFDDHSKTNADVVY
jgi:hypothetical protein